MVCYFNNEKYNKQNLLSLHSSPDYVHELDLCVVAPDKRLVAYCIGWHDSGDEHLNYIKPVGTHNQYRKRSFASAAIKECFRRLKQRGIKTVTIAFRAEPAVANFL